MAGSTRAMALGTVVTLVLVTGYSVTLGGDGWLWFGWVLLALATVTSAFTRP